MRERLSSGRGLLALVMILGLLGLAGLSWAVVMMVNAGQAADRADRPLESDGSFSPVAVPTESPVSPSASVVTTAPPKATVAPSSVESESASEPTPDAEPAAANTESVPEPEPEQSAEPEQSTGSTDPALRAIGAAWECSEGDPEQGQVDWAEAAATEGAAVFIPSVCAVAPLVPADVEEGSNELWLPRLPAASWYEKSAPLTAIRGNTYVAGHLNHADGTIGPFKQLEAVPMGAPVMVRDDAGQWVRFKAVDTFTADQDEMAQSDQLRAQLFSRKGPHTLSLVTCVLGPSGNYDINRVLMAVEDSA